MTLTKWMEETGFHRSLEKEAKNGREDLEDKKLHWGLNV